MSTFRRLSLFLSAATVPVCLGVVRAAADPAAEFNASDMRFDCWDCTSDPCPDDEHLLGIIIGSIDPQFDGPTHGCEDGDCADHAGCIGLAADVLDEVAPAVAQRDLSRLAALAKSHPELVIYNPNRQSYQIAGCNGVLIANVPVAAP